jgi:hypothetical protein
MPEPLKRPYGSLDSEESCDLGNSSMATHDYAEAVLELFGKKPEAGSAGNQMQIDPT